jgi:hypothetical protein
VGEIADSYHNRNREPPIWAFPAGEIERYGSAPNWMIGIPLASGGNTALAVPRARQATGGLAAA